MAVENPGYMTVAQVAELLAVNTMTVYRMIKSGEIQAVQIRTRVFRIPEREVRKFLPSDASVVS